MISTQPPSAILSNLSAGVRATVALIETAAWCESRTTRALVLEGSTGSGKSLAAAWGHQFVRRRARPSESGLIALPVWSDARLICAMVGHEWRREEEWRKFDAAPLVVIDDVGTETEPLQMRALLERAWNVASGRIVLTLNVSPDDFSARYGERVFSRVAGSSRWVALTCNDMRLYPPPEEPFRRPNDETALEMVDRLRAQNEAAREDDEWERNRPEREQSLASLMSRVSSMAKQKHLPSASPGESDAAARVLLQQQLNRLRAARSE